MHLHADLSLRVVTDTGAMPWIDAPAPGVRRRMLDRDGGEIARATSLVEYAAGAAFPTHQHEHGEEIFVLEGTLADEHGEYGPGTYLKNPPGSAHAPRSATGCILFVKLRHLLATDQERVVVNTARTAWRPGLVDGLSVMPLAEHEGHHTALVRWAAGTRFTPHRHYGGEEIFVLEGVFQDEHGVYPRGTWIRSPHLSAHRPFSEPGCTILVKTGHLHA